MTRTGIRDIWTTWEKCSFPPRSTLISRDWAVCRRCWFSWRVVVFPLLWWTEWFQLPLGGYDVSSPRFPPVFWGSCCGAIIYLPWLRTVLHPAGMCVKVPLSPQNLRYTVDPLSCFICAGLLELVGCHTLIEAGKRFGKALVSGVHSTWTCVKLLDYTLFYLNILAFFLCFEAKLTAA